MAEEPKVETLPYALIYKQGLVMQEEVLFFATLADAIKEASESKFSVIGIYKLAADVKTVIEEVS